AKVEVHLVKNQPPPGHRHSTRSKGGGKGGTGKGRPESEEELPARVIPGAERTRPRTAGRFYSKGSRATVVPEDGRLPTSFRLTRTLPEANQGDIVVAEFTGWDSPHNPPTAAMIEVLGRESDPGVDILAVIHRYALPLEFPEAVLREA